ncbi:MAG: OB-fold nucleic acid binding domain-containing protein [Halobacteriales archaeon]
MSTCIICGAPVEGHVCGSHEQDVCFEFRGNRPGQLTPGRFYRGTVDGFAEFGVFIDVGDSVTGLLHTSELDKRLESLTWDPGDSVYVQVKSVRDDGNVDLGWSIRQHESEFRGKLIDHPEGDRLPEGDDEDDEEPAADSGGGSDTPTGGSDTESSGGATSSNAEPAAVAAGSAGSETATDDGQRTRGGGSGDDASDPTENTGVAAVAEADLERTPIEDLADLVGDPVAIEGSIVEARQTSGPTVFEVRDETGSVECAAFESAGVRAYPGIDAGDVVRLEGLVEERRGDIQIETESLVALEGDDREAVETRLEEAIAEQARPEDVDLLADHGAVAAVEDGIVEAATAIRRAIIESRPVVLRHSATVDGYAAAAAIERAALPLVRAEHEDADSEYHYVSRRPLDGRIYGMRDAVRDATNLLDAEERHGEPVPLFVFVNAGSTAESEDGFELLAAYGADRVVIDADYPDAEMEAAADVFLSPHLVAAEEPESVSTTALGANVATHVSPEAREEVQHLPAVSYWGGAPEAYRDLAVQAGYDDARVATVREAIALEAFYGTYDDKRELVADLLFDERDLAEHAAEQFRDRVETELRTAEPHVERHDANGATLGALDADAFTHRYEFPPIETLLSELADRDGDLTAVLGIEEDRLLVWSEAAVDMREVGMRVADAVPDGGVETRGGRDGHLVFLSGERDAVVEAAIEAVADQVA